MINKCQNIKAFEFKNTEIIVRLHRGNPVYGYRLVIYKIVNPLQEKVIFDESQFSSNGLNGWIEKEYDKNISDFVNRLLDAISS